MTARIDSSQGTDPTGTLVGVTVAVDVAVGVCVAVAVGACVAVAVGACVAVAVGVCVAVAVGVCVAVAVGVCVAVAVGVCVAVAAGVQVGVAVVVGCGIEVAATAGVMVVGMGTNVAVRSEPALRAHVLPTVKNSSAAIANSTRGKHLHPGLPSSGSRSIGLASASGGSAGREVLPSVITSPCHRSHSAP
jgi:hypothetical protein